MVDSRARTEGHANGGSELKLHLLYEKMEKLSRKELSKWWEIESLQRYIDVERVPRDLRIYTIPTYEDPDPEEWAENCQVSSLNMMKILIKYESKDRKKILDEIEKVSTEILSLTTDDGMEEFKENLEKKLSRFEDDIMSKKQRKCIRDFWDYQSGRILSFHRKYDHLEGQTKENKYFPKAVGVEAQEVEEEEPGSKDTRKEKKSPGKQVCQPELRK
ncbi:hypothetical protein NDU88_002889 [Pleurodeles waltl]|uniref:Uncharacterized protein n=1 Tax=Pleurodeles waltl TaxID=8319 RepID=A0AAV7VDW3_PLEWA|nr:hypothetical protein NDU88_002889 [Pleurodeles waltl]